MRQPLFKNIFLKSSLFYYCIRLPSIESNSSMQNKKNIVITTTNTVINMIAIAIIIITALQGGGLN